MLLVRCVYCGRDLPSEDGRELLAVLREWGNVMIFNCRPLCDKGFEQIKRALKGDPGYERWLERATAARSKAGEAG